MFNRGFGDPYLHAKVSRITAFGIPYATIHYLEGQEKEKKRGNGGNSLRQNYLPSYHGGLVCHGPWKTHSVLFTLC